MKSIIRNVRHIEPEERRLYESLLGDKLHDNQQVIIQVVTAAEEFRRTPVKEPVAQLPDWCNVYEGLSDEQIAEIEEVILARSDLTRPSP